MAATASVDATLRTDTNFSPRKLERNTKNLDYFDALIL